MRAPPIGSTTPGPVVPGTGLFLAAVMLVLVVLVAPEAGVARASATEPAAESAAERIVERHNDRDIGSPGWRRIRLELVNDGRVTRTFVISHAWREAADAIGGDASGGAAAEADAGVSSLVLLEAPRGLRGTSYLLAEGPGRTGGMDLSLHLPASKGRVLTIQPTRFDEGLLGSDFTYSDLRWRLPTEGFRFTSRGEEELAGRPVWVIDAEPMSEAAKAGTGWGRIRYRIDRESLLRLGADYYRGTADATPTKVLRVERLGREEGLWTPERIVMRVDQGRSSVLTLVAARFHQAPHDEALFTPGSLPAVAAALDDGSLALLHDKPAPPASAGSEPSTPQP